MSVRRKMALAAGSAAGFHALRTFKSVARANSPLRRYWEKHLLDTLRDLDMAVAAGGELPLIYVAFGDSAAQGLGADNETEGYVPVIAAGIKQASGREVALLNMSLSGATATSVLVTQIPQLRGLTIASEAVEPDIVTLDIGGNDTTVKELPATEFEHIFNEVARELPRGTFIGDVPTFRPLKVAERASDFARIMREQTRLAGHHVIGLEALSDTLSTPEYMIKYHAPDLFHPNSPWYALWAQEYLDAICDENNWPRVVVDELPQWTPWRFER
ncbi:MAG: hypothetical protein GX483_02130 [Actinomycetaceae bacterium]|nr:hypothetical protein [Actinomycetaceae bacterium]